MCTTQVGIFSSGAFPVDYVPVKDPLLSFPAKALVPKEPTELARVMWVSPGCVFVKSLGLFPDSKTIINTTNPEVVSWLQGTQSGSFLVGTFILDTFE